ncbi:unnamed protein product [Chondrus crispus]|uniref:Reverse transcriptase domain-containing protein n=1 Tax=Chondrus crispus TaxID=2769 RepID=R7QHJ7_CHOCR|nr:unnamed protein product [Chondrus crispus]CDF37529.1 unnamed protein product [Chondrus crispus]|eukprot:XP_005717400.1 unnamed protein product [Chondrus crispus]
MWTGQLGKIGATKHRIELEPGARQIYKAPYPAGPTAREKEKTEIDRMLRAGVIEPATAEWASPVVFVRKKEGTMRFCVDYRTLNAVTVRDSYPLLRMDECINSLGDATTTFASHCGLYRFLRMPFGLKNAPATFQRAVDIILSRVKWETALVYLYDVIIYSKTVTEHCSAMCLSGRNQGLTVQQQHSQQTTTNKSCRRHSPTECPILPFPLSGFAAHSSSSP